MTSLIQFIKEYIWKNRGRQIRPTSGPPELQAAFSARYHYFKLLLAANNRALELMADLQKALEGNQPFGLSFVRSNCTAISVNVFRMIKYLEQMAPGKYTQLFDRFKTIQDRISTLLIQKKAPDRGPLVIPFHSIDRDLVDLVGMKMAYLAELKNRIHLPVPSGYVITSSAYREFVEHNDLNDEINRRIQATEVEKMDDLYRLSSDIQRLIIDADVPATVEQAILEGYRDLERQAGQEVRVSMRSSALGEDAAGTSYAGQFRSRLNVTREGIIGAYKEVVASMYGLPAVTYRLNQGIPDEEVAMCVGCMNMVGAVASGVMYSRNPLNIKDSSVIVNSAWGLPKAVVDGSVDPDVLVVVRDKPLRIVDKRIMLKKQQYVCNPGEGLSRVDLTGEKSAAQSINDRQVLELASVAITIEEYYGVPQDIEWAAHHDGSIFILQSRPLPQYDEESSPSRVVRDQAFEEEVLIHGGVTAAAGIACGPVFVAKKDIDKLKFPEGAVLVTSQPLPGWASLLNRAVAIVTEVGGVAGHLANVAREFGVPAIFGIPEATKLLDEGQLVTVDAEGLTVYRGRVESLLTYKKPKRNLMQGSPVYETLVGVAAQTVPLNLLDPDSPHFHPTKCETLHDITRFVHEKSVYEIFRFGKEHHFEERSSKQLVHEVPMQWWVINLDDGFKKNVDGKFVHLDNIASIPMLALWEGATAIPWEGPPPVDTRGFMSVLVQATADPALEPAAHSPYAARNYFMISKNFCSLSSRFGFHFTTVEAFVSNRPTGNYVSFTFKGGAADYSRRVKRTVLVGRILEEFGFRIQLKEDNLAARLEVGDAEFMKDRLRILGYLIIHTRQLDMVMSDPVSVETYRTKFRDEINSVLSLRGKEAT